MDSSDNFWNALVTQNTLIGLSDRPGLFREVPLSGIVKQAWRARSGQDDGIEYLKVPF
jgi:hypothetical protein